MYDKNGRTFAQSLLKLKKFNDKKVAQDVDAAPCYIAVKRKKNNKVGENTILLPSGSVSK